MRLFNTEMMFLHPPRTRFGYGRHAPRLPRYGRRSPPAPRVDDPVPHAEAPARVEAGTAAPPAPLMVVQAA